MRSRTGKPRMLSAWVFCAGAAAGAILPGWSVFVLCAAAAAYGVICERRR